MLINNQIAIATTPVLRVKPVILFVAIPIVAEELTVDTIPTALLTEFEKDSAIFL